MQQVLLRFERSLTGLDRTLTRQEESFRLLAAEIQDHRREFQEEYEAQRGTLLAILDRLDLIDPREGPAAGA
jgi:hypothetical protein